MELTHRKLHYYLKNFYCELFEYLAKTVNVPKPHLLPFPLVMSPKKYFNMFYSFTGNFENHG